MAGHIVYRLLDEGRRALYVGVTNDVRRRINEHRQKAWFADVRSFALDSFDDRQMAEAVEEVLIRRLKPLNNVIHRGGATFDVAGFGSVPVSALNMTSADLDDRIRQLHAVADAKRVELGRWREIAALVQYFAPGLTVGDAVRAMLAKDAA